MHLYEFYLFKFIHLYSHVWLILLKILPVTYSSIMHIITFSLIYLSSSKIYKSIATAYIKQREWGCTWKQNDGITKFGKPENASWNGRVERLTTTIRIQCAVVLSGVTANRAYLISLSQVRLFARQPALSEPIRHSCYLLFVPKLSTRARRVSETHN